MHRNRSVDVHQFAMIPRADIPRSSFRMQAAYKTTFDASFLIPFFCEEVLPGDLWRVNSTAFARLATPLFPFMDNLHFDSFWFFVPNRLVWDYWKNFMGERFHPSDIITAFNVPQMSSPADGYGIGTVADYFGLPTVGQVETGKVVTHSALPFRMYNLIFNEWFRDQNLVDSASQIIGNPLPGVETINDYPLRRRGKRHDYFTSCLPFLQKGTAMPLPLGTSAPVVKDTVNGFPTFSGGGLSNDHFVTTIGSSVPAWSALGTSAAIAEWGNQTGLHVDLSAATASTINQLRQAFQIQKLLERDARGGTRYTEIIWSHFGVKSPDARLQRPEYLGGSSVPIAVNPVAQTSATSADGTDTPQGNLSAFSTGLLRSNFTQAFTEHGYIIGICNVRADLTYQQGLRRHWSRQTRYDFYFPVFAMLGEQAVLSKEIFSAGDTATDENSVFGYQERWGEYRYMQSQITGLFRSTAPQTIDPWHLSERFASRPSLNTGFIEDQTDSILDRVIAVGEDAGGQQFICDMFHDCVVTRPMPLYSVPGMIDHF